MINEGVLVRGKRLCLVPYLPHHVPRYHRWMCDPELLRDTASEPLTLAEEYANQAEWMRASDKLTFILLAPLPESVDGAQTGRRGFGMIGDCNLFRLPREVFDSVYDDPNGGPDALEVEVMIADRAFRRKGFGEEATRLLMAYALDRLGPCRFVAKILDGNTGSAALFVRKLGFTRLKEVPVFHEVHYIRRFQGAEEVEEWKRTVGYECGVYSEVMEREMTLRHSSSETETEERDASHEV